MPRLPLLALALLPMLSQPLAAQEAAPGIALPAISVTTVGKTVLRNEYGIRIGHTGTENKEDFIVLDNERFFYSPGGEKDSSVTIYKQSKDQPLAVCELDVEEGSDMSVAGRSSQEATRSSLLLTLCWYLFQPVKAAPAEGYLAVPEYSLS